MPVARFLGDEFHNIGGTRALPPIEFNLNVKRNKCYGRSTVYSYILFINSKYIIRNVEKNVTSIKRNVREIEWKKKKKKNLERERTFSLLVSSSAIRRDDRHGFSKRGGGEKKKKNFFRSLVDNRTNRFRFRKSCRSVDRTFASHH